MNLREIIPYSAEWTRQYEQYIESDRIVERYIDEVGRARNFLTDPQWQNHLSEIRAISQSVFMTSVTVLDILSRQVFTRASLVETEIKAAILQADDTHKLAREKALEGIAKVLYEASANGRRHR